jgi:hypothetical protein
MTRHKQEDHGHPRRGQRASSNKKVTHSVVVLSAPEELLAKGRPRPSRESRRSKPYTIRRKKLPQSSEPLPSPSAASSTPSPSLLFPNPVFDIACPPSPSLELSQTESHSTTHRNLPAAPSGLDSLFSLSLMLPPEDPYYEPQGLMEQLSSIPDASIENLPPFNVEHQFPFFGTDVTHPVGAENPHTNWPVHPFFNSLIIPPPENPYEEPQAFSGHLRTYIPDASFTGQPSPSFGTDVSLPAGPDNRHSNRPAHLLPSSTIIPHLENLFDEPQAFSGHPNDYIPGVSFADRFFFGGGAPLLAGVEHFPRDFYAQEEYYKYGTGAVDQDQSWENESSEAQVEIIRANPQGLESSSLAPAPALLNDGQILSSWEGCGNPIVEWMNSLSEEITPNNAPELSEVDLDDFISF